MEKETHMSKKRKTMKNFFIPDDIVIEIFLLLPAKSLLRLRWACKYWFDLITSRDHDDFIKMHFNRSTSTTTTTRIDDNQNMNNKSLLLISRTPSSHVVSYSVNCSHFINNNYNNSSLPPKTVQFDYCNLPAWIDHHTIRVGKEEDLPAWIDHHTIRRRVGKEEEDEEYHHRHHVYFQSGGSCNALIFLYSSCDICYDHSFLEYQYFLWNPSTRELNKLPPNKSNEHLGYGYPRAHFHGFGYDHTIDDYKVTDIFILYYPLLGDDDDDEVYPEVIINIYTLGSNSWSTKINTDQLSLGDFARINVSSLNLGSRKSDGCFSNGALHWITEAAIMSFDIVEEEFRVYPQLQPPNYSHGRPHFSKIRLSLEVLNGCLCIVVVTEAVVSEWNNVELWMMKDYGLRESWTKLFTIDSQKLCNICGSWYLNQLRLIELCKDGGEILMVFNEQCLVLHDLKNGKHRWVHRIDNLQYVYVVESFIESLVSLKSGIYLTTAGFG